MGNGRLPGLTGHHHVNIRDGTHALCESPRAAVLGGAHADDYHTRHPQLVSFSLTHSGHSSASGVGFAWRYSTVPDVGWLYDFKVNRAELLGPHKLYLDQAARRLLSNRGKTWNVGVQGLASRTGDARQNQKLSEQRAAAAFDYLRTRAPGVSIIPYGVGEHFAADLGQADENENMFFRAVIVSVWETKQDPPPPPPPPPPPKITPTSDIVKEWRLRIIDGWNGGISAENVINVGADTITIEILDVEENLVCQYHYSGKNFGVGVPIPKIPISAVKYSRGNWRSFNVPRGWSLEKVKGQASIYGGGASLWGSISKGRTDFHFAYPLKHRWYWDTVYHQRVTSIDVVTKGTPSAGVSIGGGTILAGSLDPLGTPTKYNGD